MATARLQGIGHPGRGAGLDKGPSAPSVAGGVCGKGPWEGGMGLSPLQSPNVCVQKRHQASRWADGQVTGQTLMGCRSAHRPQTYTLQGHECGLPLGLLRKLKFSDSAEICPSPRKAPLLRRFVTALTEGDQTELKQINTVLGKYLLFPELVRISSLYLLYIFLNYYCDTILQTSSSWE